MLRNQKWLVNQGHLISLMNQYIVLPKAVKAKMKVGVRVLSQQ
jgi:hypothetical protein